METRAPLWALLGTLVATALVALSPMHVWLSRELGDVLARAAAPERHYDNMLVVDIDEASLRELAPLVGGWPLERDLHARVLDVLRDAGAAAVAIDIVYADPRAGDDRLAAALRSGVPTVVSATGVRQRLDGSAAGAALAEAKQSALAIDTAAPAFNWPAVVLPHPALVGTGPDGPIVGMTSTPLDADGVLRSVQIVHRSGDLVLPATPVALVQALSGDRLLAFDPAGRRFTSGRRQWPADESGRVAIRHPANADAVTTLPYARLARVALGLDRSDGLRERIAGRTVVLGSSAFPGEAVMTPAGQVSGLHWVATATAALLAGDIWVPTGLAAQLPLWVIALAPLALAWRRRAAAGWATAVAGLSAALAILAIALGARILWGLALDPVLPLVATVAALAGALAARQHRLMLASREAEIQRAVAEASNRAKSEFLANVSHEIRTPMHAVLGVADLLSETDLTPVQRRHVEVFRRSGEALACLIDDLLDLSKIEAGRVELQPAPFGLANLLREQVAMLRPRAMAKGLELGLKIGSGLPSLVLGDRMRLTQVLVNLLANAIKFTPRGSVSLEVDLDDEAPGRIRFAVIDTGIGIDAAKLDRIFEPFVQADARVEREFGGTGLGLTITRRIVELMGGQIRVTSAPGRGSEFSFSIPLPAVERTAVAPRGPLGLERPPGEPKTGAARALRILVADDNPTGRYIVKAMLDQPNIRVEAVESGRDALKRLAESEYDLVLMDIQMPDLDGLATTRALRRMEAEHGRRRTPVIALSANAFETDRQRSFESGCDEHLAKPVRKSTLMAAIERWTAAPAGSDRSTSAQAAPAASPPKLSPSQFGALGALSGGGTIDVTHALDHLGGDVSLYFDTLRQLSQPLNDWPARFQLMMSGGELERCRHMVHDLKGILDGIGALAAMRVAAGLETALGAGDESQVRRLAGDIERELQPVAAAIRAAVAHLDRRSRATRPGPLPPTPH